LCIFGRLAVSIFPFDGQFFAGPDHYGHMHNVNLIKQAGMVSWDSYWYGGAPFLRFYPPLSFSTAGFLAGFMDDFDAYKLVLLLAFALTPIAAYLLFKEFFSKTKELLFATALFSFTVQYASIADAGQFPTVFAIPFGLLFMAFFIRYVKTMRLDNFMLASIFLALTALGHLLVTYTSVMMSLVYLATYFIDKRFDLRKLAYSSSIYLTGLALSSFWVIPTIIENKYSTFIQQFSTAPIFTLPFINFLKLYGVYPNFVTIAVSIIGGILLLYGLWKTLRPKGESLFLLISFLLFLAGYMGLYFLFPFANFHFSRWIMLMPVITTIIITKALNHRVLACLAVVFLLSQVFLFMAFPERTMPIAEQQSVAKYFENKEGRTIYLPRVDNTFDYLLPKYNNEGGIGFFPQGLSSQRLALSMDIDMYTCVGKANPLDLLSSLDLFSRKTTVTELSECEARQNASDELFMLQNIKYVIINNNYPEVLSRFENDSNFTIVQKMGNYTIAQLTESKYIMTDLPIRWNYTKSSDRIDIDLSSDQPLYNVSMRISESWYPNWKSEETVITNDSLEYMVLNIAKLDGSKHVTIKYVKPAYQQAGTWITLIAWLGLGAMTVIKRRELFHLE